MSFNEFRHNRISVKKNYEVANILEHIDEKQCAKLLVKIVNNYKEHLLKTLQIPDNLSYRSVIMLVVKIVGDVFNENILTVDYYNGKIIQEIPSSVYNLCWIPIRPFLQYRNKPVFDKICFLLKGISKYVDCQNETFRDIEHDMLRDNCDDPNVCLEDIKYDRYCYKQSNLYNHYINLFKTSNKTFTDKQLMLSVKKEPALKEFFKDAIAFLKNPSYPIIYNGFSDYNHDDFIPIETSTIYNFCWDFDSEIDEKVVAHVNSIANEAGHVTVAYEQEIGSNDIDAKEKFTVFNNLFTKNYELYQYK